MARRRVEYGDCDLWWPEQSGAHGCLPIIAVLLGIGAALARIVAVWA